MAWGAEASLLPTPPTRPPSNSPPPPPSIQPPLPSPPNPCPQDAAWQPQPYELSDMAERLAELCAKAAVVPQYCEYGACGPMQRRVSATLGTGSCCRSLCWGVQLGRVAPGACAAP